MASNYWREVYNIVREKECTKQEAQAIWDARRAKVKKQEAVAGKFNRMVKPKRPKKEKLNGDRPPHPKMAMFQRGYVDLGAEERSRVLEELNPRQIADLARDKQGQLGIEIQELRGRVALLEGQLKEWKSIADAVQATSGEEGEDAPVFSRPAARQDVNE